MALSEAYIRKINYYVENLPKRIYKPIDNVGFDCFYTFDRLTLEEAKLKSTHPAMEGEEWGVKWEYGWFFSKITIPEGYDGERIVFKASLGECIVYVNGKIYGALDKQHKEITLSRGAIAGQEYDIAIEAYGGHDGLEDTLDQIHGFAIIPDCDNYEFPDNVKQKVVKDGSFGVWNDTVFQCLMDIKVLYDLRNNLDDNSLRKAQIDKGLKNACDIIDMELPDDEFIKTLVNARDALKPVLDCKNGTTTPTMYAIGHSHLDLEWLWTKNETVRKIARTVGNQLRISDEYKDYKYIQSQPWLMEELKNDYPDLYADFKQAVSDGRFIAEGGMWVEADTNIPSGESLVRQFMFGKKFLRDEIGVESELLWLPDIFGCSAALPQIMKGCGIKYFMNAKITWLYDGGDPFPCSNFMWKGIDGSKIHTFITQEYTTEMTPSKMFEKWSMNCEKEDVPAVMVAYGHGDGGGGATRIHTEYIKREHDLEGMPKVVDKTPLEYFEYVAENCEINKEYIGELYYAAHRGSYTTQAKTKQLNRRCEFSLRDAEIWSTLMGCGNDRKAKIDEQWKKVLFNQFHDIIPGTSIAEVYEAAEADYNRVINICDEITDTSVNENIKENDNYITVFNSLSWDRTAFIELEDGYNSIYDEDGNKLEVQNTNNKTIACVNVPSVGCKSFRLEKEKTTDIEKGIYTGKEYILENNLIRAVFNKKGQLISFYDKNAKYEVLSEPSNVFKMYKDMPLLFDAWDVDEFYENQEVALSDECEIFFDYVGEIETALVIKRKVNKSDVTQRVIIRKDENKLDFETEIEWNEVHKLLKVDFNTAFGSDELVSEIQYGHIKRPTHKNRQYDEDRFEVCQHKWSMLDANNRGIAILNDSKYGISAKYDKLSLTLLKSAMHPDFCADKGKQKFVYSIMSVGEHLREGDVCRKAYELNCPVVVKNGYLYQASFVNIDNPAVIMEALKTSEDGNGDIIIRMYESKNSYAKANISLNTEFKNVYVTDMLENNIHEAETVGLDFELEFAPFEVKTVRIVK